MTSVVIDDGTDEAARFNPNSSDTLVLVRRLTGAQHIVRVTQSPPYSWMPVLMMGNSSAGYCSLVIGKLSLMSSTPEALFLTFKADP